MSEVLRILVPLTLWLASFSLIYGLQGLGCALDWSTAGSTPLPLSRMVLLIAWLAAVLAQIAVLLALNSERLGSASPFVRRTSLACAWVGLAAAVWTLLPVATLPLCR